MNRCDQMIWLVASLIVLAIVAHRCHRFRDRYYFSEPETYTMPSYEESEFEASHTANCEVGRQPRSVARKISQCNAVWWRPRSYEMPLKALSTN